MHNPPKLINPRTAIYACGGCLLEFRAIIGHPVCPLCGEVDQAVRLKSTSCRTPSHAGRSVNPGRSSA